MNIPDQAIQAAAEKIHAEGWTCEAHEPLGLTQCDQCAQSTPRLATKALEAALPHIRAQIQAEWADYIDNTTAAVGNTLTLDSLAKALRAPHPPFGHHSNTAEEGNQK